DKHVPTGRMNLGSLIGDHTKTAILTRLMTGSYIGYGSMIGCSTIPPKFVRSFSFLTDKGEESYDVEKALSVARRSYDRRQTPWRDIDERILRYAARIAPIVEGVTTA